MIWASPVTGLLLWNLQPESPGAGSFPSLLPCLLPSLPKAFRNILCLFFPAVGPAGFVQGGSGIWSGRGFGAGVGNCGFLAPSPTLSPFGFFFGWDQKKWRLHPTMNPPSISHPGHPKGKQSEIYPWHGVFCKASVSGKSQLGFFLPTRLCWDVRHLGVSSARCDHCIALIPGTSPQIPAWLGMVQP